MIKILIVEDNKDLILGLKFALKKEGYEIFTAENINDAEYLIDSVELIILDIMLPDGNGYDLCKKIRQKLNIPIIFLTACDESEEIIQGFNIGADDYITKPFKLDELLLRIKAIIRRCYPKNKENDVVLSSYELKLLNYLKLNSNIILSRNQLLTHLWDSKEEFVDDNTLSVLISRLREKIDTEDKKHIKTIRGIGYKWMD